MVGDRIREYAAGLGVEMIGFCDVEFSGELPEILKSRREKDMLSGFEEQDENVRIDVKALMPEAKTIIAIALPYKTIEPYKKKPYFSRASIGLDYHRVMRHKLELIGEFISSNYGGRCIAMCDTNPLVEREIAKKTGIGYQGKNTNIITERYGSFVFLGELITDLYIDRDVPIEDSCGSCEACLKACPANALERAYCLNAKKCLSFITQKKEQLTVEEIDKIGTRIYGCDICQEVCPKNCNKPLSKIKEFWPAEWNYNINEEKFLKMTNSEFKKTFGTTSSGWRGKAVLLRNMLIAMGNSGDKAYLKLLNETKEDRFKVYSDIAIKKILESDVNE